MSIAENISLYPGVQTARLELTSLESAPPSADFSYTNPRPVVWVPTYETDIAIPPEFGCICGNGCTYVDQHHNGFDEPYWRDPPHIKDQSNREMILALRSSPYNRFWVTRCAHVAYQPSGLERAPIPSLDLVERFIEEAEILSWLEKAVRMNKRKKRGPSAYQWLTNKGFTPEEILENEKTIELASERSLEQIGAIEAIPEEIVTSALVYSVPEVARQRLQANPNQRILAPASWPKAQIRDLVRLSQRLQSVQTEGNKLKLAV